MALFSSKLKLSASGEFMLVSLKLECSCQNVKQRETHFWNIGGIQYLITLVFYIFHINHSC